jgi:hypothetical protein
VLAQRGDEMSLSDSTFTNDEDRLTMPLVRGAKRVGERLQLARAAYESGRRG